MQWMADEFADGSIDGEFIADKNFDGGQLNRRFVKD